MAISQEERIKKIDDKMAQLKAQKQAIVNREKEKERKERTRRLIQNGALAEQYLSSEGKSPDDFKALLEKIVTLEAVKKIVNK